MLGRKEDEKTESMECTYAGRWPPDLSALSSLGFDKLQSGPSHAVARQVQGRDLAGREKNYVEIRMGKKSLAIAYSCPVGSEHGIRRLQAALLLLRVLAVVPGFKPSAYSWSAFLLPSLERSLEIASSPYERLERKSRDLEEELSGISLQRSRLLSEAERSAKRLLQLENENSAMKERLSKLESVPDPALCELLLSWLRSHRGQFDSAAFSEAHSIPPPRCEQGLEMLLERGAIVKVGDNAFSPSVSVPGRSFILQHNGLLRFWPWGISRARKSRKSSVPKA